ncbi:MAG: 4Fe-4S binding protein, partial [Verrucomicrobiae bacterium]|nr:4Fe-4S binding protein [Verrucomicrobiae bacterium]
MQQRSGWRRARAPVQVLSLILFVLLTFSVNVPALNALPHDLFLWFDPLPALLNSLSGRVLAQHVLPAVGLVFLTVVAGRVFCGWICPLGTVIDGAGTIAMRKRSGMTLGRLVAVRFGILGALVGAAILGWSFLHWLDPLVIGTRVLHLSALAKWEFMALGVTWGMLLGAVGLTLVARRFWCRVLCPLGAMLSLVARLAFFRRHVLEHCEDCGSCLAACPLGNSAARGTVGDCLVCGRCESACARGAIRFGLGNRLIGTVTARRYGVAFDRNRRRLLAILGGLIVGSGIGLWARIRQNKPLLRPPGAVTERQFVARCVGCGACMAVCPTEGLRPVVSLGHLETAFSPELVPRTGPCLPDCVACGEVCPTGAIRRLSVPEK